MSVGNQRGIELFKRAGALLFGHFRLQSGRDGVVYVAKDLLWQNDPEAMKEICLEIAKDFVLYNIEAVVGPESGAVEYAKLVAENLARLTSSNIVSVRARKTENKQFYIADEDLPLIKNKRVLVIEDVFTTGESVSKVIALLRKIGCLVNWVGGVWNRGGVTAKNLKVGVLISQIDKQYPTFEPGEETCPGCKEKILYDLEFGHGKKLVGTHPLAAR
jgi:orotate phosphoribosyltransferase